MSHPIGKQIRAILEASDRIGKPAQASVILSVAGIVTSSTNATRLCRRAEKYGLADAIDGVPLRFMARQGWRDKIKINAKVEKPNGIKAKPAQAMPKRIINSVWSWAQ